MNKIIRCTLHLATGLALLAFGIYAASTLAVWAGPGSGSGQIGRWWDGLSVVFMLGGAFWAAVAGLTLSEAHKALRKAAHDAAQREFNKFRRVYTEADGERVRVLIAGGDVGRREVGSFRLDEREELQNALAEQQKLATDHRQRLVEAERLSATLNKTLA